MESRCQRRGLQGIASDGSVYVYAMEAFRHGRINAWKMGLGKRKMVHDDLQYSIRKAWCALLFCTGCMSICTVQ